MGDRRAAASGLRVVLPLLHMAGLSRRLGSRLGGGSIYLSLPSDDPFPEDKIDESFILFTNR